jgi:hypothetical protein
VSLKKQVVTLPKEKISAVAHTFSSNEEKIAQLDQIIEKCTGKVIIIDQSRTFLEKLDLLYKRKWPDKNFQLVTAFSKNSYSPNHDGHTLGSPSMGLGISIDEPIEYFIVCFNDFIASPDSFEQTLARLRNNVGQNRHTKIVIIVEEKSIGKFKTFDEFTEELKYTWSEILSKVDHYLTSRDKQGLAKLLHEKNLSYSGFLNYQNGYHVHDPTYLEILIQSEAESRFVSYYGAKSFIQYFIRNPEKLSSIVIQSLESTITDNDVENEDNTELLEIIKEEGEKSFAEIKPCYNRKEMLTLKKQLKEPSKEGEKQELLIKHISTLKFEAKMAGGLEAKNMTSLKRALSKKFSYRVINTWLYLKSKGLEVQNTSEEQIFVELCTGKEIPAVLFQIARTIWALWTECGANEECANKFSDLVQKYLSSLSPPELQEAFHSKSPKQLKETLGKLLKLFGIIRIKRKKSKKDDRKEYFSFVSNPEITIKSGISFSVMQTWVNSHLTGLGKLLITSKIDNISELDDVDEILKEIQAVFNGVMGGYSLFKPLLNSHVKDTLPKRTFVS